jgi:hypothetical protein
MARVVVNLTHFECGPMRMCIDEEATWWLRKRQWSCFDDPELGAFDDADFQETEEQINAALRAAEAATPIERGDFVVADPNKAT